MTQLTVLELRKQLEKYPDDAKIFMEASNALNKGNTGWAQELLDIYECNDVWRRNKKAVMLVGSIR